MLNSPMNAQAVLDREFLEIRAKILELAASFDRLDRSGDIERDERLDLIQEGISMLDFDAVDRAEKVQFIFSREYDPDWREKFQLS